VNFEPAVRNLWRMEAVKETKRWVTRSPRSWDAGWQFNRLADFIPAVRRVRSGTSPQRLDQVLEIEQPVEFPDKRELRELLRSHSRTVLTVPADAAEVYVQVEWFDGALSEVTRFSGAPAAGGGRSGTSRPVGAWRSGTSRPAQRAR
jgi:hypothetical protein